MTAVSRLGVATLVAAWLAIAAVCAFAAPPDRSPPFARALHFYAGLQARVLWLDATANLDRITTREGVCDIVQRARDAGLTTIVVDVKPVSGHVLFPSALAPRLREWRGKAYPEFDVLAAFLEEGRQAGLEIAASINVFSDGHKLFQTGPAYERPDWQSMAVTVVRSLRAPNGAELTVRAEDDPEDARTPLVQSGDAVVSGTKTPGGELAVVLAHDGAVTGFVDTALLGDEPLSASPEDRLMVVSGAARDWAVQNLRAGTQARFRAETRLVRIQDAPSERVAVFVSPMHPASRSYQLALIRELLEKYPVDSLVLDRMRYASLHTDFSPAARAAFQQWLGQPVQRWPQDVLEPSQVPGDPMVRGRLFQKWLEFRARTISQFLREVRSVVKQVRPETAVAAYVGSWFSGYYGVGVNWASERYPVNAPWATSSYSDAGYAELLDWLTTGCYYPVPTRDQARAQGRSEGATVETAAVLSSRVTANAVPVYAGLYALNYEGRPQDFAVALDVAVRKTSGVMLFDCSHLYAYDWWSVVGAAFRRSAFPPHLVPGLQAQIRAAQDALVAPNQVDSVTAGLPAVPTQPGGG